jgi:HEAT repeat protein
VDQAIQITIIGGVVTVAATGIGAIVTWVLNEYCFVFRMPEWTKKWSSHLSSKSWWDREQALKQLAHPNCAPAVRKIMRMLKRERDWQVAVQACKTLTAIGNSKAVAGLRLALFHIHPYVRREAALALGTFGDSSVASDLIQLIERDNDENAHYGAIVSLGKLGTVSAGRVLERFLSRDDTDSYGTSLKEAARSALVQLGVEPHGTGPG